MLSYVTTDHIQTVTAGLALLLSLINMYIHIHDKKEKDAKVTFSLEHLKIPPFYHKLHNKGPGIARDINVELTINRHDNFRIVGPCQFSEIKQDEYKLIKIVSEHISPPAIFEASVTWTDVLNTKQSALIEIPVDSNRNVYPRPSKESHSLIELKKYTQIKDINYAIRK